MTQPTPYTPAYDFSDYQTTNPNDPLPGDKVDDEFAAIDTTIDEILANLAVIQRDDTALAKVVTPDSLTAATLSLMGGSWTPKGDWATATAYVVGDVVENGNAGYVCATAHTSGTFSTDRSSGYWVVLGGQASLIAYDNATSGLTATDIQAAIDELENEIDGTQPLDATLTALAGVTFAADKMLYATAADTFTTATITSFGRTLLDDADAATARATLGALASDLSSLTAATVASGDLVAVADIDDSNNPKKVTAQSIADLASVSLSAVAEDIIPDADSTRDLGSATKAFAEVYADAILGVGADTTIKRQGGTNASSIAEGVAKAYGEVDMAGTAEVRGASNIASLTDNGTGDFTLTIGNDMNDAVYSVTATAGEAASGGDRICSVPTSDTTKLAGSIKMRVYSVGSTPGVVDDMGWAALDGDLA